MKKEKIKNFLFWVLIFATILSIILIKPINNLDEIWNFNFARNIANGLIPYKDYNMLQMPLLPILCGIILKITFNELIIMRILASLLCTTILYIAYKIFNLLNIQKQVSIIFVFIIGYLFYQLYCIDYNYATLLLALLIIYNEIKEYKKDSKFIKNNLKLDLFLGILAGLTITLKQTTGIFICTALLGNKLLFVKNKFEFKTFLKSFVFRVIGALIPVGIMFIYLLITGALNEFINYTIKGVSGFSNYISYRRLIKFDVNGILAILVPITFAYVWIKTVIFEKDKISYIFCVYGLAMFVVCFPISDEIHFLIGAFPTLIFILYEFYRLIRKTLNKYIKGLVLKILRIVILFIATDIILTMLYFSFVNYYNYFNNEYYSNLKYYKSIPISIEYEQQIKKINEYINLNDKNVKILDAQAAVYMIPNNRYNKDYDMLLKGNLGENGEEKIINEISNSKNTQYLILNDKYHKNWQTPLNIIDYIKENKTKVGEIEIFDIFE